MRKFLAITSLLLMISLIVQFYLAGLGVFSVPEEELFLVHGTNGRIVLPLLALLVLIGGVSSRLGKRIAWLSVLPLVMVLFQTVLFITVGAIFNVGPESAEIPLAASLTVALHTVNGLAIFYISTMLIRRSWPYAFQGKPVPERAAVAAPEMAVAVDA